MLLPPPEEVWPAERLFRLLIRRPRPRLPLAPLSFAPRVRLSVRGLRGAEEHALVDDVAPDDRLWAERLVVAVTYEGDRPAFSCVEDLGEMRSGDFAELRRAIFGTKKSPGPIGVVSPTYNRSDSAAWGERLRAGASHDSNMAETLLLGQAFDWTGGGEQPDRYFGAPLADLTDGQLMAYRAARDVIGMMRKTK